MLADLVHHVRQHLPLKDLSLAVNLFSKNVHDESLPSSIQTMSCKLLLNLVECIRLKSDATDSANGRELLMRMLEVRSGMDYAVIYGVGWKLKEITPNTDRLQKEKEKRKKKIE